MTFANPITVLAFAIFAAGFTAGAAFAGFICFLETRKWRRRNHRLVGVDFGADDHSCTVYGHYLPDGSIFVERVEFPESRV